MDTTYNRIFGVKYSSPYDSYQYNIDNADYNRRNFPLLRIQFRTAHEGPRKNHKKNSNGSVLYSYMRGRSQCIVARQSRDIPQNIHATTVK